MFNLKAPFDVSQWIMLWKICKRNIRATLVMQNVDLSFSYKMQNVQSALHQIFSTVCTFSTPYCVCIKVQTTLCPTARLSSKYNSLPPLSGIVAIGCRETVSEISLIQTFVSIVQQHGMHAPHPKQYSLLSHLILAELSLQLSI